MNAHLERVIRARRKLADADEAYAAAIREANLEGVSYRAIAGGLTDRGWDTSTMAIYRIANR